MLAQNCHGNVTGMSFGSLHALFQDIYEDHFAAQDDLAERVRALEGGQRGRWQRHWQKQVRWPPTWVIS